MKYGLALGGGASRGLAHIGIIQYLEENNITIEEIAGTSIGAIIGGCFAIGLKSTEMKKIVSEINFLKLIDLNLSDCIVSGNKVYQKLYEIFGDINIEDTKIPLKIIATDFTNGTPVIFTQGKLIDAIRASISIPGVFKPFISNNQTLIDGGLSENLPISILNSQNIIAVSVIRGQTKIHTHRYIGKIKFKKWILGNTYETLKKSISIIMINNENYSLKIGEMNGKNIILLTPDTGKFEYFDFHKYNPIIDIGYEYIKNAGKI